MTQLVNMNDKDSKSESNMGTLTGSRAGSTRRRNKMKLATDEYKLIVGSSRLVGTDQWILVPLWLTTKPLI